MIDNSIKITQDLLSVSQCPTLNKSLISGSKRSKLIDQTLKSQKIECKNDVVNVIPNENRKQSFLFKQTQSYNCSDEQKQSEVDELCFNIEQSEVFLQTKFSQVSMKQNMLNNEKNEFGVNIKVDKQKVRKVSQQIATYELLNLQQNEYQKYKQKTKIKETKKINSKTLYNSHKHNLSYKNIRQNSNNNCEISQEVFTQNNKNNSCLSPRLRNRLSTSPTKMRAHMSQHLSNFQLLKLQAEKLNKSNILINTPGYSKCRPNSGKKQQQKAKYYHNYIFHNNELPCQNRNMNRKISHETISSNHKTSNKTMQTFNQNKNMTNRKEQNVLKTQGDEVIQPRVSYKHKKNNSNVMFSKTKNQTGYANLLIGNQKNEKNCNKSCSQFYNNRDQSQNIKIQVEQQQKVGVTNEQYLISNQFVPFVSRSIWDKNRKNIKKISGGVTKILNIKNKFNRTLKQSIKQGIKTNENINKFIKNKLNLIQNNCINDTCQKQYTHKRINTANSFYDGKQLSIGFQKNQNVLKQTNNNKINHHESSKSAPKTFNQSKNIPVKVSNAEKFYKAQQEKHQAKSQLLVVDPLLKTKAIEMGSKQQKKNNDIVIICF